MKIGILGAGRMGSLLAGFATIWESRAALMYSGWLMLTFTESPLAREGIIAHIFLPARVVSTAETGRYTTESTSS